MSLVHLTGNSAAIT